jgi:hypothetical protein
MLSCGDKSSVKPGVIEVSNDVKKVEPAVLPAPVDTILDMINRITKEEMAARNLKFDVLKRDDAAISDSSVVYDYVFPNDSYTKFILNIHTYDSESAAESEMVDLKRIKRRMIKNDELVKISHYYFRIGNDVYSFFCTANIDHIRHKIYNRIIKKMNIKEEDIEQL